MGVESGLPRQAGHQGTKVEGEQSAVWGMGAGGDSRTTNDGVLLNEPDPGTRPGTSALDDRRALDTGHGLTYTTVKDVSRQSVRDVLGLDRKPRRMGHPRKIKCSSNTNA